MLQWFRRRVSRRSEIASVIAAVRDAVVAILRIHPLPLDSEPSAPASVPQFQVSLVGTAWCIVENRFLVTAYHVFNNGAARDPNDRFYVFAVPQNGPAAYPTVVTGFPIEDSNTDMAVLEIARPLPPAPHLPAVPITFERQLDGQSVVTYGFPSPVIATVSVDPNGNWIGGDFFLKGHANEGIVSGQFETGGQLFYELNVGWYNGESGGPIFTLVPIAVFAVMQQYRNIQTQHGIVPGPRQARAITVIESKLRSIGARVV